MKIFEKEVYDVFSQTDLNNFIKDINEIYPNTLSEVFTYNENLDDRLLYIDLVPKLLFGFQDKVCGPILLNVLNTTLVPENIVWHIDSSNEENKSQITMLLYLQIDPNGGGNFSTIKKTHKIEPGNIIVLPSNEVHRLESYEGEIYRISLKWMFNISDKIADTFRDSV